MTTREEYASAATTCEFNAQTERDCGEIESAKEYELAATVLRALADGAVLCEKTKPGPMDDVDAIYTPLEPQP